jgi:hypothetical protein
MRLTGTQSSASESSGPGRPVPMSHHRPNYWRRVPHRLTTALAGTPEIGPVVCILSRGSATGDTFSLRGVWEREQNWSATILDEWIAVPETAGRVALSPSGFLGLAQRKETATSPDLCCPVPLTKDHPPRRGKRPRVETRSRGETQP